MVSAPANKMTAIPNAMRQIILITLLIFLKVYNRPTCKNNKNIEYISVGCSSILYAHKTYLELFSSTAGCVLWASCRRELFDTPFDTGIFRTGHGGGSEVAGSRHFECSPSVVFSAGGEQGDFV